VGDTSSSAPMTGSGHERRISAVRNISALPPRADVGADIVEQPVSAITQHRVPLLSSARKVV
jgi:hypothetical protein